MKNDVSFVTCIYDDLHDTKIAGRHNRGTHYAFSLGQIVKIGAPIYCYTDRINLYRYMPSFLKHGYDNVNFISYNLFESPYHHDIQKIKNKKVKQYLDSPAWRQRSVEIMWGKFDWIIDAAERIGLEDNKYLYWIDAGLSHPGVLPEKYNTVHNSIEYKTNAHEYNLRFYNDLIFNNNFPDYLVEKTGKNKFLSFMCKHPQHSDPSNFKIHDGFFKGTVVGGLFGGNVKKMYHVAKEGKKICEELIKAEYLIKEEDILTYVLNKDYNESEYTVYSFKTWYHEDWGIKLFNPERGDTSFSGFFEDMVK